MNTRAKMKASENRRRNDAKQEVFNALDSLSYDKLNGLLSLLDSLTESNECFSTVLMSHTKKQHDEKLEHKVQHYMYEIGDRRTKQGAQRACDNERMIEGLAAMKRAGIVC